jgi:EAL domain-containing protein (putative c-di-GMP-specific phosphodiesterase class I)
MNAKAGFVRELTLDASDAAIVGSTIELGRRLGLSVIAEGIEDNGTAELLTAMGCKEGQATTSANLCRRRNSHRLFLPKQRSRRTLLCRPEMFVNGVP